MSRSNGGVSYGLMHLLENANRLAFVIILCDPLVGREGVTYNEIHRLTDMAKGTVTKNAQVLERAGYIASHREFVGPKTRTTFRISAHGRRALEDHRYAFAGLPELFGLRLRDLRSSANLGERTGKAVS